ncbi:hypothetical protein EJ03DRAFT_115189 [Teratosphaeria nubilosa]|uniref:Uncharacterized protein n=1 Tax=Teratosphaeria nubilosa TaxID=161662 RepID=A0A6G1L849_9PEZI|nr:hypothetical protein EJ03DRAFT_115189 [Teratosphaeria nubilosa]
METSQTSQPQSAKAESALEETSKSYLQTTTTVVKPESASPSSQQAVKPASRTSREWTPTILSTSYLESTTILHSSKVSKMASASSMSLPSTISLAPLGGQATVRGSSIVSNEATELSISSMATMSTDRPVASITASTPSSSTQGRQAFPFAEWHGPFNMTSSPNGWSHGPPAGWHGGPPP